MAYIIIAIMVGVLITVTPILNGINTQKIGSIKTAFWHNTSAFTVGLIALLVINPNRSGVSSLSSVPPLMFIGGLLGLSVIVLMNYYSTRIRALHIAIIPFLGQMFMGFFLDAYLLNQSISLKSILGMCIVLIGLWIQSSHKVNPNL